MTPEIFIEESKKSTINEEVITKIEAIYGSIDSDELKRILSIELADCFLESDEIVRLLKTDEILEASEDLNVNFSQLGYIPVFDVGDNNFVIYDLKLHRWAMFNIGDSTVFSETKDLLSLLLGEPAEDVNPYDDILTLLSSVLPEKWEKVCLYSHVREDNYEFFFYVKVDGKFIQYIELEKLCGVSKEEIRGVFDKLYEILLPDFMENAWNVMTYIVTNEGKYNVEYDYEDFDDIISYRKAWKEKYLN